MSDYALALVALLVALVTQATAAGLAIEIYLRRGLPRAVSRTWLALASGSLLLALYHGYTLELALQSGLYDLRQALLAGLIGICFALGINGLRRLQP